MGKANEWALWCLAGVAIIAGFLAFDAYCQQVRDGETETTITSSEVNPQKTERRWPVSYALLAQQLRAAQREIEMSSGSAKSGSSVVEPTHPMPCCGGQPVSSTLYATITTPVFGPVIVELNYADTLNVGLGWYGTATTCEGLVLSVIVYGDHCGGAMMLAETPWHASPTVEQICIAGDSTFEFSSVTCDPLILDASGVAWGLATLGACRCGIAGVEDLSPATVTVTE